MPDFSETFGAVRDSDKGEKLTLSKAKASLTLYIRANKQLEAENARLKEQLAAAQAKIDSLMLEYCPEEMTSEQMAEWAAHQEPTTIDAAIAAEKGEKK